MKDYETTYILQENLTGNVKVYYCLSDLLESIKKYVLEETPFTMSFMSTKIR